MAGDNVGLELDAADFFSEAVFIIKIFSVFNCIRNFSASILHALILLEQIEIVLKDINGFIILKGFFHVGHDVFEEP